MDQIDDGGPAYPHVTIPRPDLGPNITQPLTSGGKSLRDWFAGQALVGLAESGVTADYSADHIASTCWKLADAMIRARKKLPE